ncbi:DUF6314 family protein [Seohaeicola zhoushanensis]|uniref:DUF6314 domain-containing protein n=1 Tax=Seohaeicola zhoushanensis TaxID=1569283 RepID=A0A8J3M751_9RHOB|nr:DUF6314 family protein [Seohaeicola zhoushanensis]GHF50816.1 hypothetical protein GCM10017056_23150 [Seohaeicola zhoushanensis]
MRRNALAGQGGPGLADFAGRWALSRVIDDALAGQRLMAEGFAQLAPDAQGLVYDETVELQLADGQRLNGTRRYLWRADPAGGIAVHFADGRLFHRIAPGGVTSEDRHDCAPDLYVGAYDFTAWPMFRVVWQVRGPRKDYRMETLYRPA